MALTVDQLIKRLEKISEDGYGDHVIHAHDYGAPYDFPIGNAYKHPYDEKEGRKKITLGR